MLLAYVGYRHAVFAVAAAGPAAGTAATLVAVEATVTLVERMLAGGKGPGVALGSELSSMPSVTSHPYLSVRTSKWSATIPEIFGSFRTTGVPSGSESGMVVVGHQESMEA